MKLNTVQRRLHDARSYKSSFLAATLGAFTFAAVNCNGLTPTQDTTKPIWPTKGWQTSTPEAQGMDSADLAGLVDFGRKHSLDSLLITQGNSCGGYGLYLEPRDMAKIGYLYLRDGVWEGKQLIPQAWIEEIKHATVDMNWPLEPGLRYSNFFWALPDKHVYMAVGHNRQVIMVFPDLDIVAVTTARGNYSFSEFADLVTAAVRSDTELASNPAGAKVLANKLLAVSTQKSTEVGPASSLSAAISGKVYKFPPNDLRIKSLSLFLGDAWPHYDLETYPRDTTASLMFTGPIGFDGQYRNGELVYHGFSDSI